MKKTYTKPIFELNNYEIEDTISTSTGMGAAQDQGESTVLVIPQW